MHPTREDAHGRLISPIVWELSCTLRGQDQPHGLLDPSQAGTATPASVRGVEAPGPAGWGERVGIEAAAPHLPAALRY